MRLAIHLPNQQQVVFQSGQEVAAVARASMRHTTLTEWFLLNQHDVEAHNYNYADIPQGKGDQVTSVASTGIVAMLLDGGRNAHSVFKIPLVLDATSTCNVTPNSPEAKLLREIKIIIWDEAPMTHIHAFLAVNRPL
ncbi:hypothetical protein AVEN_37156-1 [Araneus ventricosus]|uniref:ATP-dependent DNA helicase n=1 Tax=Araneus ventricosus TaxID=182803 RepID=A0A4Y2NLK4_ARAVE|nr:hypothetical protein AVEN_120794-1 [Araneus ventricosus]GBN39724.1 hypothetical protein AVEN_37156-1 [Araneus ventricosus]